jgi:hypothetical protein
MSMPDEGDASIRARTGPYPALRALLTQYLYEDLIGTTFRLGGSSHLLALPSPFSAV